MMRRVSREYRSSLFHDRADAGRRLAERLDSHRGGNALILGIPRGGVPVAAEVARRLDAELDVVVARKLGAPGAPEFALGAVTANGGLFLDLAGIARLNVPPAYLDQIIAAERAEARLREASFRGSHPKAPIAGRTVIVVDDGLATGATMRAAIRSVRKAQPARLVIAIPVGPSSACEQLGAEADEVVCLYQPEPFLAVGLHYERFDPTEDDEVHQLLREAGERHRRAQQWVS
jgi:putative phosphoribosyl transferase